MSDPNARLSGRLHLETRCFVDWLRDRGLGEGDAPRQFRERLRTAQDAQKGRDPKQLWDEFFDDYFNQWIAEIRNEARGEDLTGVVQSILGEPEDEVSDAKELLKKRIACLREKIALVAREDEEFESDLAAIDKSLATYQEVLEQFAADRRLDEVLRRGVKQAVLVKERDFEWFEALLERFRSEKKEQDAPAEDADD